MTPARLLRLQVRAVLEPPYSTRLERPLVTAETAAEPLGPPAKVWCLLEDTKMACPVRRAPCDVPRATCPVRRALYDVFRAVWPMRCASCGVARVAWPWWHG